VVALKESEAFQPHTDASSLYFASVCRTSADYKAAVLADFVADPGLVGSAGLAVEDICSRIVSLSLRDDMAYDHAAHVLAAEQGGSR
jgi:hypothetical protein